VKLLDDLAIDISCAITSYIEKQTSVNESKDKTINEIKYKNLFEKNLAGVYRTTLDGNFLEANRKFVQMMGYGSFSEMKKSKFSDFFENKALRGEFVHELKKRGHLENVEHKLIRKDGSFIWVLKNVSMLKDEVTGEKIIQGTVVDITQTRYYLDELKIREDVIKTIAEVAADIFKTKELEETVNNVLRKLGTATNVSRVYLFENNTDKDGIIYCSQRFEWTAENIAAQIDNPELQNFPLEETGFGRWTKILSMGEVIKGNVDDFPKSERELLKSQNILSILVLPIFVDKKWWGFIGFDSCEMAREWSDTEENALRVTADLIGNAIQRFLLEKELSLREAKLKETSQLAGIGHFEFDTTSKTMSFSESFYDIFGGEPGTLGNTFEDIIKRIHPEDRKMVTDIFQYSVKNEKSGDTIFRIMSADNSVKKIWAKWNTITDEKGAEATLKGIVLDITEREAAEERILKLSQAVEYSPAMVVITDNDERIEYVNNKFTSITGYKFEEVQGRKPSMWASGYHGDDFYEDMLDAVYSGKEWTGEIKNRKKNGELFWLWTSISPLINTNGDITHYVAVSLEITEKKQMMGQLAIAKKRAEESDKIKSEFLALISHEIRTPLNVILGYNNLIQAETENKINQQLIFAFDGIDEATSRIIRSIELVINAAEIISGSYAVNKISLDLKSLVEEIYPEFKTKTENKGLELIFTCKTKDTVIEVDKYSIMQMLIYLLENAVKFTNEGRIEINMFRDGIGRLALSISDTGIGMHNSFLDKIFIPFSQEDSGLSRAFEGMGLGSTLIKKYAEINNAEIRLNSIKDVGTTFDIVFSS
jgi:PAS domain S-box-containing protein